MLKKTKGGDKMQTDLFGNIIKDVTMWHRLSEDERKEIINKAKEKKKAKIEEIIKINYDIDMGRQRSIIYAWEP